MGDPSSATAPIVVVEDDDAIGSSLVRTLVGQGWPTVRAADAAGAIKLVDAATPLVILDLGLPDADGLDVCRELRRRFENLQVLILTARGEEADVVLGLDAGAEDYLVKPFRLAELLARVRVRMRRAETNTQCSVGLVSADFATRSVTRDGVIVDFRPKEFDLLWKLLSNSHRIVPREEIITDVWDENWFGSTKTLDIHIVAIRKKLDVSGEPSVITTVRGVGYRMSP